MSCPFSRLIDEADFLADISQLGAMPRSLSVPDVCVNSCDLS
jgi:hypothetical protein